MLHVEKKTVGVAQENTYCVVNETGKCLIIDPGAQGPALVDWIQSNGWQPQAVLLTHAHFDHIGALDHVRQAFGIPAFVHPIEKDWLLYPELNLSAGLVGRDVRAQACEFEWESLGNKKVGEFEFEIRFVPGHSPGHVAYIFAQDRFTISGDALFYGSIGRTDLPGGNHTQLLEAIQTQLFTLPDDYKVYAGHGMATTIGFEKDNNPYFR